MATAVETWAVAALAGRPKSVAGQDGLAQEGRSLVAGVADDVVEMAPPTGVVAAPS